MFDPDHWERAGAITGQAAGRGSALLLDTPFGEVVLREYLRGGWPARVSRDRYFFTGYQRSRRLAEFRILAALAERGLPVPRPVAALCDRLVLFQPATRSKPQKLRLDSCWFDGRTEEERVRAEILEDAGNNPESGVIASFFKIQEQPLGFGGRVR